MSQSFTDEELAAEEWRDVVDAPLLRWLKLEHGASNKELAGWFAVSDAAIRLASSGKNWPHVPYGLPTQAAE